MLNAGNSLIWKLEHRHVYDVAFYAHVEALVRVSMRSDSLMHYGILTSILSLIELPIHMYLCYAAVLFLKFTQEIF